MGRLNNSFDYNKATPFNPRDSSRQSLTPKSPEPDTPLSPEHSSFTERKPKFIPLEREEPKPRLSEQQRKNKLLKLASKLEGKNTLDIEPSQSLFLQPFQEPDSQKLEDQKRITPVKSPRQPWLSPPDPE